MVYKQHNALQRVRSGDKTTKCRHLCTADCKSLATSKLNSGKPQLCLNREVGAGKIIIFTCGKSIVVFHLQLACCKTFAICCIHGAKAWMVKPLSAGCVNTVVAR